MRQPIIHVDVDDALVRSFGTKRIKMPPVTAYVRKLKAEVITLYF